MKTPIPLMVAALSVVAFALCASPATASTGDGGLSLPDSVEHVVTGRAIDYEATTRPTVECRGESACVVASTGRLGSARLSVLTFGPSGASLWYPFGGSVAALRFSVYDAAGELVEDVKDFSCELRGSGVGNRVDCGNTVPNWSITIPAGGKLAPAGNHHLVVFLDANTTSPYPVGHEFADKNHWTMTEWDTQRTVTP